MMISEILERNAEPTFEEFADSLIEQFKGADHFYIIHYCKKRDNIEERRCYWDEKSKIWLTKDNKIAITCVALNNDCLLYTSPSPRDQRGSRMPSSA